MQKKSNCIFLLNKINFKTVRIISFDDWLAPTGLFIDKNSNILAVAPELDRHYMEVFDTFIHVITPNGRLVQKIEIEQDLNDFDDQRIRDCCIIDKFVFIC